MLANPTVTARLAGTRIEAGPLQMPGAAADKAASARALGVADTCLPPTNTITASMEPDETLVVDPRGALSPSQMVDRKLLALLGSEPRSVFPKEPPGYTRATWAGVQPHPVSVR